MKILMCVGDKPGQPSGCGLYRIHLPARRVKAAGHEVTVTGSVVGKTRRLPDGRVECWQVRPQDFPFDLVVFQRPAGYTLSTFVRQVGKILPVVVELDDDLERTEVDNFAYGGVHPSSLHENWRYLKDATLAADLVTGTTPALGRYARTPDQFACLPNYVPASMTRSERAFAWDDDKPRLGWSGQVATHPHDLQTTRGAVGRVLAKTGYSFHVIGPTTKVAENLMLGPDIGLTSAGWVPLVDYPDALTAIDVGIVPLADSTFNHAKSSLKGMEFAALGIPFVASPTPEYQRLHDEFGIGLLAKRPRDWERHLTALLCDEAMRRELGEAWRARVRRDLTAESNGWRWVQAYEKATEIGAARLASTTAGR